MNKAVFTSAHLLVLLASVVFISFQNCSPVQFSAPDSEAVTAENCTSNPALCPAVVPPPTCQFNGVTYNNGDIVTAYLHSTVPMGSVCISEPRVCKNGSFTGSYTYSSCQVEVPKSCLFNGQTIPHGERVRAFQNSSVPFGDLCKDEYRVCDNGNLSGSYNFAACTVGAPASCLFNGQTVAHGQSIIAYITSSVAYGKTCQPMTRTCVNGTLSGSGDYASCTVNAAESCLFNGQTIPHGGTVKAFQNSSVPFGSTCTSQTRTCTNGTLSGTYNYSSCTEGAAASCLFNGQTIAHGQSVTAYVNSSVPYGQICKPSTRTCVNGTLDGAGDYATCTVDAAASCLFNGRTIPHTGSVTAYQNSSVPYGSTCSSQSRICTNGTLSGSYNYSSCSVGAAASCLFNGQTIAHGQTVTAFASSSVVYGSSCSSQARTCNNGSLSGSYTYASCSVGAPASCLFNGQTVAHGGSVTAYASSSVPYGSSCSSQARTCSNGSLSGSYTFGSCSVGAPSSCLFNGQTVAHGQSVTAYAASSVPYGSSCSSQVRTCNNGSMSGSYGAPSCAVEGPKSCSIGGRVDWSSPEGLSCTTTIAATQLAHGQVYTHPAFSSRIFNFGSFQLSCNNGVVTRSAEYCRAAIEAGSPLMIHFNSDVNNIEPLEFTSPDLGIIFDILGMNSKPKPYTPMKISWYKSPQYFFIVLPNQDGDVKGIDQLFGDNTLGPDGKFSDNGYEALRKYDGTSKDGKTRLQKGDGYITEADAVFNHLRLWNDSNSDGIAQAHELTPLKDKGIEVIDLNADPNFSEYDQYGNETALKSVVKTKDGRYHLMFDIWFAYKEVAP